MHCFNFCQIFSKPVLQFNKITTLLYSVFWIYTTSGWKVKYDHASFCQYCLLIDSWTQMSSESHTLMTTLNNFSVDCFDDQLSAYISRPENSGSFLAFCTYAFKLCPKEIEELISCTKFGFSCNTHSPLFLEFRKLTTNHIYKTKHILDTLPDADMAYIIVKYPFSELESIIYR